MQQIPIHNNHKYRKPHKSTITQANQYTNIDKLQNKTKQDENNKK